MRWIAGRKAVRIMLMAGMLAGCSTAPGSSASPSEAAPTEPLAAVSPTPSAPPTSTARPVPSPTATAVATPPARTPPVEVGLFPWLPPIDASVTPAYRPDDLVASTLPVLPVSGSPGGAPYRFDTGDPDPATHPLMGIGKGFPLVVLHGPVVVDDVQWFLLTPAQLAIDIPTGWSPLSSPTGDPWLEPSSFVCPASPMTDEQLAPLSLTDGLPACFGDAEVTIAGDLECEQTSDPWVTGAPWLTGGTCSFPMPLTVYGLEDGLHPGRYAVTGHFDDDSAKDCRDRGGDDPESRLNAILHCRRAFVATSAVPVP